ncbi:MAG: RNA polymerase sigma factor [Patescibacteria group bacterium]
MESYNAELEGRELMERARNGDNAAFSLLYDRHAQDIFRYAYFRVRNVEEAEDIMQTVFMKAFEALPRFQDQGKSPLAFLFTIARNTVINQWRKKKEVPVHDLFEVQPQLAGVVDNVVSAAITKEMMQSALATAEMLTPDQREVIMLKFMHELDNKEIAVVLEKSEEAVRQLQSRGLRTMRDHMKKDYDIL